MIANLLASEVKNFYVDLMISLLFIIPIVVFTLIIFCVAFRSKNSKTSNTDETHIANTDKIDDITVFEEIESAKVKELYNKKAFKYYLTSTSTCLVLLILTIFTFPLLFFIPIILFLISIMVISKKLEKYKKLFKTARKNDLIRYEERVRYKERKRLDELNANKSVFSEKELLSSLENQNDDLI